MPYTYDSTGSYANVNDGVSPGSPLLSDGNAMYTGGESMRVGGTTSTFFAGDILGSVEDVSDSTGANPAHVVEYEPFGSVLYGSGSAVGSPFRYCGAAGYQTSPDTGLILAGNRWYDPAIGRFLTRDPSGSGDNPYPYAGNSPVSSLDPLGLQASDSSGGGGLSGTLGYVVAGVGAVAYGAGNSLKKLGSYLGHQLFGTGGTDDFQVSLFAQNAASALRYHFGNTSSTFDHYLSAPTYGLPYLSILQGDPYGDFLTQAVPIAGQTALAMIPGVGEAEGGAFAINVAGEGEVPGVLNVNGPWLESPGWLSSDRGVSYQQLQDEGHQFLLTPRLDQLPFETGSVDTVFTNSVRIDGPPSHLGPYPSSAEIWRILHPAGSWFHDGILQVRP